MSQPSFVELARSGDPHAISVLIARALKSQKIKAHVSSHGSQLQVLLEAEAFPRQDVLAKYIYQGIARLNIPLYESLIIYGKQMGEDKPDWKRQFSLVSQDESLSSEAPETESTPKIDSNKHSSSDLSQSVLVVQSQKSHQIDNTDNRSDKKLTESATPKNTLESLEKLVRSVKSLKIVSPIAYILLWVGISFNALFLLYSLVWAISDRLYTVLGIADKTGLFSSLINQVFRLMYEFWDSFESTDRIISRISGLGLMLWFYSLHTVLKWSFKNYPISPWGSVGRYAFPFYNLWGIWNIFSTLANHLIKERELSVAQKGEQLKRWFPRLYIGLVLSILANVMYYFIAASVDERESIPWWFYVASNTISLALSTLYLKVVRISHRAVLEKAYQSINPPR
jgi:hypothetical protein